MNHIGAHLSGSEDFTAIERGAKDEVTAFSSRQMTLSRTISCVGIGLHSGASVRLTLRPAAPGTGIVFRRVDLPGAPEIPARWDHVVDTTMCSVIGNADGVTVGTVEHLMAAFAGCHVDNAVAEVDGPEVPVMDGSSQPFVFLIECAGLVEQGAHRRIIEILKPVRLEDGERMAELTPGPTFTVGFEIDFDHHVISRQKIVVELINGTFKKEIARARTFGFAQDVEKLRAAGLARGGSFDNAVVIGEDCVLNKDGLRYDDEFVRHKVLDAVGDLYLAGATIRGNFMGVRAGHNINNRLLRALFADETAWRWVTLDDEDVIVRKGSAEDVMSDTPVGTSPETSPGLTGTVASA